MIVAVRAAGLIDSDGHYQEEILHEGPYVEESTEDGELLIRVRDEQNRVISWTRYAAQAWWTVRLVEAVDPEVKAAAMRRREAPAGNSGIY